MQPFPRGLLLILLFLTCRSFISWAQTSEKEGRSPLEKALEHCVSPQYDSVLYFLEPLLEAHLEQGDEQAWYAQVQQTSKALRKAGGSYAIEHLKRYAKQAKSRKLSALTRGKIQAITANELKRDGLFHEALIYFEQALKIFEIAKIESDFVASVYRYTGNIYTRKGNYSKAVSYLSHSLEVYDRNSQEQLAKTYADLSLVYIDLEEYKTAKTLLLRGLKQTDISAKQQGILRLNLSAVFEPLQQLDSAMYMAAAAEQLFEQVDFHRGLGDVLSMKAKILELRHEPEAAIAFHRTALEHAIIGWGESHREIAKIQVSMQHVFQGLNQSDQAILASQEAMKALIPELAQQKEFELPESESLYPEPWLIHALKAYGRSMFLAGPASKDTVLQAFYAYELAIDVMNLLREDYLADGDRNVLLNKHFDVFSEALEIALHLADLQPKEQMQYWGRAFLISEQSRAYNLFRALAGAQVGLSGSPPDSLLEETRLLQQQLWQAKRAYRKVLHESASDKASIHKTELLELNRKKELLDGVFREKHPAFYRSRQQLGTISMQTIQEGLRPGELLLEFFKGSETRYLFAVSNDTLQVFAFADNEAVQNAIRVMRKSVSKPPNEQPKAESYQEFVSVATLLYDALLAPALQGLKKQPQHLILLPDPSLAQLPLGVLLTKNPEQETADFRSLPYLLLAYTVSYQYAAHIAALEGQQTAKTPANGLLFFAPEVDLHQEIHRGNAEPFKQENLTGALPGTAQELQAASGTFRGAFVLGVPATVKRFQHLAANYDILHLSMHATANRDEPMQSMLHFADDGSGHANLFAYQLYGMFQPHRLVVLNACETGFGKTDLGEGALSLGRAFLYAGSQSVVTNLWSVNDRESAAVIAKFYAALGEGLTVSDALQNAKLQVLHSADELSSHPYYWAGGVAIGNAQFPPKSTRNWWKWGLLIFPLGLVFLFLWKYRMINPAVILSRLKC